MNEYITRGYETKMSGFDGWRENDFWRSDYDLANSLAATMKSYSIE